MYVFGSILSQNVLHRWQKTESKISYCFLLELHESSFTLTLICFSLTSSSLARGMKWRSIEKVIWGRSCQMMLQSIGLRFTIIYISRKSWTYLPADSWNQWSVAAFRFLLFISQCPARKNGFARTTSKISYWVGLGLFFF